MALLKLLPCEDHSLLFSSFLHLKKSFYIKKKKSSYSFTTLNFFTQKKAFTGTAFIHEDTQKVSQLITYHSLHLEIPRLTTIWSLTVPIVYYTQRGCLQSALINVSSEDYFTKWPNTQAGFCNNTLKSTCNKRAFAFREQKMQQWQSVHEKTDTT